MRVVDSTVATLLVIEDGDEYEEFARLFLASRYDEVRPARSCEEALAQAAGADAMLIDLRFERAEASVLVGDLAGAARRFGGDEVRAARWLKEQQGTLILGALREAGHDQPAVFVHDFPERRLQNLARLYGRVGAVPSFDAARILAVLEELGR